MVTTRVTAAQDAATVLTGLSSARTPWLTLVLAFLTSRPAPRVPVPLRAGSQEVSPRGRECLLATVIDTAIAARAPALRTSYDPRYLAAVTATVAGRLLADGDGAQARAGSVWVIPQLRWLHEVERLTPFGRDRLRPGDIAPPLDFGLAGLPDWPGIRVADRLDGLRGHPLAMGSERNRRIAVTALLGDERTDLDADLAITGMGVSPPLRLRHAARMMGAAGHGGQRAGWKSCCPGQAGSSGRYRRARRLLPPRGRTWAGPRPDSIRPR
jgi:hypothetical protein